MPQETEKTSLKGIFQGIADKGAVGVVQGTVKSLNPLRIQMVNDEKLVIGQNSAIIPQHLTDYTVDVTLDWATENASAGSDSEHHHAITGTKSITVHNGLRAGDRVHLLSFNHGKQYFVLGRVV